VGLDGTIERLPYNRARLVVKYHCTLPVSGNGDAHPVVAKVAVLLEPF